MRLLSRTIGCQKFAALLPSRRSAGRAAPSTPPTAPAGFGYVSLLRSSPSLLVVHCSACILNLPDPNPACPTSCSCLQGSSLCTSPVCASRRYWLHITGFVFHGHRGRVRW